MRVAITEEITAGITAAEAYPRPTPDQVFDHVYAGFSARLLRQRAELTGSVPQGGE